jgi:putative salt-induced outer membrane protein YdiY
MISRALFVSGLLLLCCAMARADEVVFTNGSRITGKITRVADGKITIENTVFGMVTADLKDVKSMTPAVTPVAAPAIMPATAPATMPATLPATLPTTSPATHPTTGPATHPATTSATTAPATVPATAAVVKPAPEKAPPPKRWSGSVVATGVLTRGNSDTETFGASFNAVRKGDENVLTLSAGYNFGQQKDPATDQRNVTTNNWFGQVRLDHTLNSRLYYEYAMLRVEQDQVANLDVRVTPGIGIGYKWLDKPDVHFNTEAGATWVYEQYSNDGSTEHFALRLAYHLDKKLNDKVSLVHNLEYLPSVSDIGDFNLNTDAGIRAMLTKTMFMELKIELKHDSTPAPGADKNDLRYTLGFGWNF